MRAVAQVSKLRSQLEPLHVYENKADCVCKYRLIRDRSARRVYLKYSLKISEDSSRHQGLLNFFF